jgi:uncharacterized membrane protein
MATGTGLAPLEVALRLLNENEGLIVNKLLESGDSMLQKDLSVELGLSPVRVHRALVGLKDKGLVTSEKYFNTNRITLSASFLE